MVEALGHKLATHHSVIEPVSAAEPGTEICDAETASVTRDRKSGTIAEKIPTETARFESAWKSAVRKDWMVETEGTEPVGRRSPAPRLCDEGGQDCRRRRRSRTGPAHLPAIPRTRRGQCAGARPQRQRHSNKDKTARNRHDLINLFGSQSDLHPERPPSAKV